MSGRPDYEIKHNFDATMAYFTESIHAWVLQSNLGKEGEKYVLLGHSMGGMFAGHYALKYPENIEKLVFMSSIGISETPDFMKHENMLQNLDGCLAKYGANFMYSHTQGKEISFTPFDFYRMAGSRLAMNGIQKGMERRMNPAIFDGPYEIHNLATYVHQMMIRKKSSELCLSRLLGPFTFTQKCLETELA